MKIAIVGGKLQGTEIAYLAREAGLQTILIDKCTKTPAQTLCDFFIQFDFQCNGQWPDQELSIGAVDLIFPALENVETLLLLDEWSKYLDIPIVLDQKAFEISRSKTLSNETFAKLGLPLPGALPKCSFPVIVKPDQASGSERVSVVHCQQDLDFLLKHTSDQMVVQKYLEGSSYSVEVIGKPGNYTALQVTDLFMDSQYDCCGVGTPSGLPPDLVDLLREMIVTIAEEIKLTGIMDLEVILHDNNLKLLEIDARFPSQTPMAVYLSSGINMVAMLAQLFTTQSYPPNFLQSKNDHVRIEHIMVSEDSVNICGEHIMATNGPLHHCTDFFDADYALTNFSQARSTWVATMMFIAASEEELESKRNACYQLLQSQRENTGGYKRGLKQV